MLEPSLPIVLIGPMCAGKSTLAHALGVELGLRYVPLDGVRFYYYLRAGFSFAEMQARPDFASRAEYWSRFNLRAAEGAVADFPDSILDFGAGHAHFTKPAELESLEALLSPLPNVFLVLPSLDPEEAVRICLERDKERHGASWDPSRAEYVRMFVRSESFRRVAKTTILTGQRSVEQSMRDVLAALEPKPEEL